MARIGNEPFDNVNIEATKHRGYDARGPIKEAVTAKILDADDPEAHGPDALTTMLTGLAEVPIREAVTETTHSATKIEAQVPEARSTARGKSGQSLSYAQKRKELLGMDDVDDLLRKESAKKSFFIGIGMGVVVALLFKRFRR